MKNKILFGIIAICSCLTCGCFTQEIKVEAVKPWENHYYDVESLKQQIDAMQLDEGESVWMMSNSTLKRLLNNIQK